jgi:transcriptional regulator with XRE-family HTH domain
MMSVRKPSFVQTLRAQWLGAQMRELREERGFTLRQAAEYLERDLSSVARWERAEWPFRREHVVSLLDLYGEHDPKRRAHFIELAEDAWRTDRWDAEYGEVVDASFIDYPWLESRAEQICSYNAMVLPGLLQTPEYAETVIRFAEGERATQLAVAKWMQLRKERQQVLCREPVLTFRAVVEEAVLRRPIGGPVVMREQLLHLVELARRPNVEVRVLPSTIGMHAGVNGSFVVFRMPKPYPEVAYVETLAGRLFVEPPMSKRCSDAYARLWETALGPTESAKLIAWIVEELS